MARHGRPVSSGQATRFIANEERLLSQNSSRCLAARYQGLVHVLIGGRDRTSSASFACKLSPTPEMQAYLQKSCRVYKNHDSNHTISLRIRSVVKQYCLCYMQTIIMAWNAIIAGHNGMTVTSSSTGVRHRHSSTYIFIIRVYWLPEHWHNCCTTQLWLTTLHQDTHRT